MEINFVIYDWDTNKVIKETTMKPECCPAVGEFIILDEYLQENYKDNMYIVRAVSTFLPPEGSTEGVKAVHVEKYNPDKVKDEWDEIKAFLSRKGKNSNGEETNN